MKKTALLLFAAAFFFSFENADRASIGVRGNVRKVFERSYEVVDTNGVIEKGPVFDSALYLFNTSGFLLEETHWNNNGVQKKTYRYRDDTLLVNKMERSAKKTDSTVYTWKNGRLVEFLDYYSWQAGAERTIVTYPKKHLAEELTLAPGGDTVKRTTLSFDSTGRLAWSSRRHYLWHTSSTTYFVYDAQGRLIRKKTLEGGTEFRYTYNGQGDVTEQKTYTVRSARTKTMEYTYDKAGNWTREVSGGTLPGEIRERTIDYY